MNFLKELREVARVCPKPRTASALRKAADNLDSALQALAKDATRSNMQRVNAKWSVAEKVLRAAPPLGGDGLQGGAMPVPQRVAA